MMSSFRLKAKFQFAAVCYSAAIFIAFGFVALSLASNMNAVLSGNTNLYLRVWGESITALAFGLILILAAFLVSSSDSTTLLVGGAAGLISSVIGTLAAIDLLGTLVTRNGSSYTQAGSFFESILIVCFLAVLLVGLPLGMVGSIGSMKTSQTPRNSATSEDTATG